MNRREAEVLEMPKGETGATAARRVAQGRATVERYVERLEIDSERLSGPEASEIFCALAELRDGLIEHDAARVESYYRRALEAFPHGHVANLGIRRLDRAHGEEGALLDSLERELKTTADADRQAALRLELARTYLYCAKQPEKTIAILETLDAASFNADVFLLWEDALLATAAWDRYESTLREAMTRPGEIGTLTQHLEERLWMLYRYILPDAAQTRILSNYLMRVQPLDDELVEDELVRSFENDDHDATVAILQKAVERLEGSPREEYYRSLLADVAAFVFEDQNHAIDILSDDSVRNGCSFILMHQQIQFLDESGQAESLLSALARSLELLTTPEQKAAQLYTIACIMRDDLENEEAALDVLREANETCPTHIPTIEALARMYEQTGEWERLAQLYEYELSYATEHGLSMYTPQMRMARHARLAQLYERLQFALNAFNHYEAMLEIQRDDIAALKGASRMAQKVGNWPELLQLYAAAEGCTQDAREHSYLLERIAQIAEAYLNDADTACTALEALRAMDPGHSNTLPSLARLYVKLKRWEELIALTNDEIEVATSPEYKATLLCRNAEVSEASLSNIPQAVLYYEKARATSPSCRQAASGLERLYAQQKAWEKLVDLYKSEASLTSDTTLKTEHLRHMAEVLNDELDSEEEAVVVYETCLRICPTDELSRRFLLRVYRAQSKWEDVLRILELECRAGGTLGAPWLTRFAMGRIELYRLHDEPRALGSFAEAFRLNPNDITVLHTWLSLARRHGKADQAIETLQQALDTVTDDSARADIELALADLTLSQTHDPRSLESFVSNPEILTRYRGRASRFVTTVLVANDSASGRWESRLALALHPRQPRELQKHGLLAAVVLDMPVSIRDRAQDVLCELDDLSLARQIWAELAPAQRPDYHRLKPEILNDVSHEAQDLRRWCAISKLLDGDTSDPADHLLPETPDEDISYRPDLELLAAYYEKFERWEKLLEVLHVQDDNSRNECERIQIALQRAWVLAKTQKPEDALECIRTACAQCAFDNALRISLYDYLESHQDWDFLSEQIRQHLMASSDHLEKCALWLRLADLYRHGIDNPTEALRCLNNAYQEDTSRGDILCQISEIAEHIGELDIARRALDDYIRYHAPSLQEQLELEPRLLTLHFKHEGGDTQRMLGYFARLAEETVDSIDCKTILAKANAIAGDPKLAAKKILEIVTFDDTQTPPFDSAQIDLWIILADLYLDKLGEQQRGEELLWELFKAFPTIDYVFERLDKLYISAPERRIFVANIERYVAQSEAIQSDSALIRKYLGFAAHILGSELGVWKEAQDLYSRALDASSEPAADLVKNRAYARCRVPGEARSAFLEFCELLTQDPLQVDIYRAAIEICRRNRASDRERILKQLARLFVPNADLNLSSNDVRPKMMDSRVLSDDILLKHLSHPDLRPAQTILHEAMPILGRVLRDDVPRRTNLGGEKVRNPNIHAIFSTCATAFGMPNIKGCIGHDASAEPTVLDEPPTYWIDMETWESMPPELQRHWAGYASGLLWTGVSRLLYSDPRTVWQLLDGIYYLVTDDGLAGRNAYTREAADRVNAVLERSLRKNIAALIDATGKDKLPQSDAQKWIEGIKATADRAGLMFSGNLNASLCAILEAEGWNPHNPSQEYLAARYQRSPRLANLVAFALSDDYLELRYHAGLSLQPSTITG